MNQNKTMIIAEAGVNHNGDLNLAKELIDAADLAGADYVKFQTFISEECITKDLRKADYQAANTRDKENKESQLEMVKKLELSRADHQILIDYCKNKNVNFLSTAFDSKSVDLLEDYSIPFYKIASSELTNLPLLRKIGSLKKPVILSTGMANIQEIQASIQILTESGLDREKITLLHCNTEYPTPMNDVNLNAIQTIKNHFGLITGYSDHSLGIEVPIAAVALGAKIIEKHFTIDTNLEGPDHKASLTPLQLSEMVKGIRNIEKALGNGIKEATASEIRNIPVMRKSIVARKNIIKGEILSIENITIKRPGTGISPMRWDDVIGQEANKNYSPDELIEL